MRGHRLNLLKLIIIIIIFIAVCFIIGYLMRSIKNLDYFKIKDITTSEGKEIPEAYYLLGRNIFDINLKKESLYIQELYPTYKKTGLYRILPNRLFVSFLKRKPIAYIKLYRYFCVDEELVLFNESTDIEESNLAVIIGLDMRIFGPQIGKKYNIKELRLALDIIGEIKRNKMLRDYNVEKIDVTVATNTSFFTSDGLEVKIGQDDIKKRINILSNLFIQLKNELGNIKYIDLRFKEPVIKYK